MIGINDKSDFGSSPKPFQWVKDTLFLIVGFYNNTANSTPESSVILIFR